jgi:hypothetical protein
MYNMFGITIRKSEEVSLTLFIFGFAFDFSFGFESYIPGL